MPFLGFSDLELKIIVLRTNGVNLSQIARQLGRARNTIRHAMNRVYAKVGVGDVALLTRWAMKYGFDELLGPETSAERPHPGKPTPRQKRVRFRPRTGT